MSPTVTVIIPAYNAELFIEQAINSVMLQKQCDLEIIVVDDNSTDSTYSIVNNISKHNHHIVCLSNNRQKGPSGARNTGLLKAKGEYIAFLDADDIWLPDHLEKGVGFLNSHEDIDVVFFNFKIIDYETRHYINDWFSERKFTGILKTQLIDSEYYLICDNLFNALLDESFMHLQSMVLRKQVCHGLLFNENVKRSEDRDFAIRLYLTSKASFAYNLQTTGVYYRHKKSLTSNDINNAQCAILDHIYLFTEYINSYSNDNETLHKLTNLLFNEHIEMSYYSRQSSEYKNSIRHVLKSMKYKIHYKQIMEPAKTLVLFLINRMYRAWR